MKKTILTVLLAAVLSASAILTASAEDTPAEEVAAPKVGELIYEQTFDMADEANEATALATLGWTAQTKAMGAYNDPTAKLAISGGRLAVTGASDSYYLMLTEEQMARYDGMTITIQYEIEYTTASNASRYFCILANYAGQKYNSFHFRNSGTANNQVHYTGSWYTYDAYKASTDIFAAATDASNGSSIAMKLLGKKYTGNTLFSGIPVTVRYILDPDAGTAVYMKLAEQDEGAFVLVSAQDPAGDGNSVYGSWDANAICLKIGGQQNGYIDNIAIWTGSGNYPQPVEEEPVVEETETSEEPADEPAEEAPTEEEPEVEKKPEKVREPQTIVNKIAVYAVGLLIVLILYKKAKAENQDK